ncbi:MAG TPA: DUF3108 domain-containing protein [Afifellaceae bacterium]|nr:DUF3108 domain-containing protein [Afifellaceae bacterium]
MADGLMLDFTRSIFKSVNLRILTGTRFHMAAARAILAMLTIVIASVLSAPAVAAGETRLSVKYGVTVAGFPVGKAYLNFELNGKGYTVTGSGKTTGVVRLFSDGRGKVSAKGRLNGKRPVPAAFTYDVTDDDGRETLNMAFFGNRVGKVELDPPENPEKLKRRVPLKRSHKIGVLDPLSALFIPADASKVCNRTLPIFDGEQRFDLVLTRKRSDRFRGGRKNFKGRVVVCAVSYRPIAGHRPDKKEVRDMQRDSGMELWMAPIGDSGVMVPISARLNTKIGPIVIRAKRFQLK